MTDTIQSYIRTYAPIAAGAVAGFLVSIGVIDTDASAQFVIALTTVFTVTAQGLWYLAGRFLEARWPVAGKWMLGKEGAPSYSAWLPNPTADAYEEGWAAGFEAASPEDT